ncbi:MAG: tail fiber domain-containing protein, partial [Acidobacteria bacterium]|nr:tail fiber domain-containing protein [Acidobacteriota bacterium]
NTTGGNNIAVGYNALPNNTTASQNCALGYLALEKVTIGGNNTGVGAFALNNLIDGINNTAVGVNSGPTAPSTSLDNTTCLGYGARSTANNQIRLGNSAVTSIGGQVGWTTLSDGRFKREITEQVPGLAFILALRPVSYVVDRTALNQFLDPTSQNETPKTADLSTRQTGFIAQEVDALTQKTDAPFSGVDRPLNEATPYGLRYSEFVVPLVKAIQEQQALIEAQKQENQKLQNWVDALSQADQKQQALIENLRKQVEDLQIQISPRLSVVSQ